MLDIEHIILEKTDATSIRSQEIVQQLWSDYGEIVRYTLEGGRYASVIVKHIRVADNRAHPKGWNTSLSHQRKLKSYQVERQWYQTYAQKTDLQCRVPQSIAAIEGDNELLIVLEDLNASGFPIRLTAENITIDQAKECLSWLAHFHAKFIGKAPNGLWPLGTYWHLDTRPDEWGKMANLPLKQAAKAIDIRLKEAKFQTLVHGDAKLANFCFSETAAVSAVDFQYVGKGCGMKDVAYFISSCFEETDCKRYEAELLHHYFNQLENALGDGFDFEALKTEWQVLYRYAWADFYRFLDGWSPGHWKMHPYSEELTQLVLKENRNNEVR